MKVPEPLMNALVSLSERLSGCSQPWLVGGSSGLLLQGVHLNAVPRDLDIYSDEPALSVHSALAPLALDIPEYSRTERYSSTLSHYSLCGVTVELVAGFKVEVPDAAYYIRIREQMMPFAAQAAVGGARIRLMPLAHELLFNLLRERSDRYEAIAETMRTDLPVYLPALCSLIRSNRFGRHWIGRAADQLGVAVEELCREGAPGYA